MTPQEKLAKKARGNLKLLHNQITGAFSLKQIPDWTTLYHRLGIQKEDSRPLTYSDLKAFLQSQKDDLEKKLTQQLGPASAEQNLAPAVTLAEQKQTIKWRQVIPAS